MSGGETYGGGSFENAMSRADGPIVTASRAEVDARDAYSAAERVLDLLKDPAVDQTCDMNLPGYEGLAAVLRRAYDQAARGKGKERHANGLPFHEQPMQDLIRMNGLGFATGQIGKKASEALGLKRHAAIHELLGVINYAAGAVIFLEREGKDDQL